MKILILIALTSAVIPAQVAPEEVDAALHGGARWLLSRQASDGSWRGAGVHKLPVGPTGLVTLALVKSGLPIDHPSIRSAVRWLRTRPARKTYEIALRLMVEEALGEGGDREAAAGLARALLHVQGRDGWGYPGNWEGEDERYADTSNTQFALLGLRAARSLGVTVPGHAWVRAARALLRAQDAEGGFRYALSRKDRANAGMTAAAMSSLLICLEPIRRLPGVAGEDIDALTVEIELACVAGSSWLAAHWPLDEGALERTTSRGRRWHLYALYAIERYGSLSGSSEIGGRSWYVPIAEWLTARQETDGRWQHRDNAVTDTAFAMLFLTRGTQRRELRLQRALDIADTHARTRRGAPLARLTGATVTASSHHARFLPDRVIDGSEATSWFAEAKDSERWIEVRLDAPRAVTKLSFMLSTTRHGGRPSEVEVRLDGVLRRRVATPEGFRFDVPLPGEPVTTLRLKLLGPASGKQLLGLAELSVR